MPLILIPRWFQSDSVQGPSVAALENKLEYLKDHNKYSERLT